MTLPRDRRGREHTHVGLAIIAVGIGAFATSGSTDPASTLPDLSSCCGSERASLGPFFQGITLGQTTKPTLPSAERLGPDIEVGVELTGKRVDAVVIGISDTVRKPPLCPVLRDQLVKAWGPPTDDRWEARTRDRAVELITLSPPSCELRFFRLVPAKQWLNASRRSVVPIWAIGKRTAQLEAALAPLQPEEQDAKFFRPSIRWQDTSISGAKLSLTAYHVRGRVIGIEVELMNDPGLQVWQRLNAMFGAPAPARVHTDMQTWNWRRAPGIVLENWVGDLPSPAPGQPLGTQDMHPTHPFEATHSTIVFGVKPPSS